MPCPQNSFVYNTTLCACNPGSFLLPNDSCSAFNATLKDWKISSGIDSSLPAFLSTVLPLDSIKKITQSEAVLLIITSVLLLVWLAFCVGVRFMRVDGGESFWFKIRWWISRMDVSFATHHWLVKVLIFVILGCV